MKTPVHSNGAGDSARPFTQAQAPWPRFRRRFGHTSTAQDALRPLFGGLGRELPATGCGMLIELSKARPCSCPAVTPDLAQTASPRTTDAASACSAIE